MRLKAKVVMILLLSSMLILTLIGGINRKNTIDSMQNEPIEEDTVIDDSLPSTFKGSINDTYNVPAGVMKVITDYMDAYFKSIYTLGRQDLSDLFSDEHRQTISEKAIDLLIETRKLYDSDFSMNAAHYDLTITDYKYDDYYYVSLLEDDYMSFVCLNGIESSAYDIENNFVIEEVDGKYKIYDLEKIQGYYMNFYEDSDSAIKASSIYDYYYSRLEGQIKYNLEVLKTRAQSEPFVSDKKYTNPYNRTAAVAYSDLYYHSRNSEWYNFSDEGGNCQNYASQCLLAGGIEMDFAGQQQWKCYVEDPEYEPEINEVETPWGRTASWVHVPSFYEYAKDNDSKGLVAECDVNLYYAEPGDIIIVGNGEKAHTVIVSKIVDGHVLVNSNSIDMKDFPIEGYTYTDIVLIKILGSN